MMSKRPDYEQLVLDYVQSPAAAAAEDGDSEQNLRFIRLLNHYRHDWMNEIQVLFGYVKLKKYDKLESLMEKIKHKVQIESYVAKLGIPDLIVYLLAYQTEVREITLSIIMKQEIHLDELPVDPHRIYVMVREVMETFKHNARLAAEGEHALELHLLQEKDALLVRFVYQGDVKEASLMQSLQRIRQASVPGEAWEAVQVKESEAAVSILLSLNT